MVNKKLSAYVTFNHPDGGFSQTFGPDDNLPDWVNTSTLDASLLEGGEEAEEPVVAGLGVTGPPPETEEQAKERRAAEAARKREQRAAKKAADEAALKAAQEAEAKRLAEQGEGGGS